MATAVQINGQTELLLKDLKAEYKTKYGVTLPYKTIVRVLIDNAKVKDLHTKATKDIKQREVKLFKNNRLSGRSK